MEKNLEALRAALAVAGSVADIGQALAGFSLALGYPHHQMAWLRQPAAATGIVDVPNIIGNIPEEWVTRYWERRYYEDDCVARGCLTSVLPVVWNGRPEPGLSDRQRRITREAARYGLSAGVSVPVRGAASLLTVVTFARFSEPDPAELPRLIDILTLGALAVAESVASMTAADNLREIPALKPVECTCLLWAARGKSTAEIGHILSMPERTVYFHVANAMDTLGVASRIQAVAEAMRSGMIFP